jgi:hypothetical protein
MAFVAAAVIVVVSMGCFIYYQQLKRSPQYSLALLVDAAKRDNKAKIEALVNYDAVVESFVPQITGKAVELYGRGLPQQTIDRLTGLARPLMPSVKERARAELPRVIRDRTAKFSYVPFSAMVLGAERFVDVRLDGGGRAYVSSKLAERPLQVEMRRSGDLWQIVSVKEEQVATDIARKIGQEMILIASKGGRRDSPDVGALSELIREAEELIK